MSELIEANAPEIQEASEAIPATQETNVTETESEPSAAKVEEVAFPKKAINAISRRDKQIGKLRAEIEHLRKQTQPTQTENKPENNTPDESKFENYGDYLKAVAKFEARQEFATVRKEEQQQQLASKEQEWASERMAVVEEQAKTLVSTIPDYSQVHAEFMDVVEELPVEIQMAFLEAENAPLAFYTLAKEGKLQSLAQMSPARAAIEIGKAEDRGLAYSKKPVTKAPQPIQAARGTGSGGKSLDNMTPDDIRSWLKS